MKNLLVITLLCAIGAASAQVYCPDAPGLLEIPSSTCCGGADGITGLAVFLREYFLLMQLDCMLDIFFDALLFDDEVLDFYIYVSSNEFEQLCSEYIWLIKLVQQENLEFHNHSTVSSASYRQWHNIIKSASVKPAAINCVVSCDF
jgi:hypothetical protein